MRRIFYGYNYYSRMEHIQPPSQKSLEKQSQKEQKFDGLSPLQILAYGMGHFLNDLTAACWFNFLLFFLKTVVKTSAASTALLAGQLCDGLTTPIVGFLSDNSQSKFGKRTPWYVLGLIIILLTFLPIFRPFRSQNIIHQYLYYSIFPGLFNIGWACLQISHMSLVPSLTCSRKRRDKLNNYRNSFSFLANFVVLTLGLAVFFFMKNKEEEYKIIAELVLVIGAMTSLFFIWQVREPQLSQICQQKKQKFKLNMKKSLRQTTEEEDQESDRKMKKNVTESTIDDNAKVSDDVVVAEEKKEKVEIKYWLLKPKFYLFGVCYMGVRLNSNIFGTFLPFYLINVLKISNADGDDQTVPFSVALVPLIIYFSSSLISPKLTTLYSTIGRGKTLLLGTILEISSLVTLYFLTQSSKDYIYPLAIIIGLSQSMILSTGINLISDVIGSKGDSGAFVFGVYSFLDKISAGLLIFFLANLSCFSQGKVINDDDEFSIKIAVIAIPILSVIVSASITLVYNISEYINKENNLSQSRMENQQFVHSITIHN